MKKKITFAVIVLSIVAVMSWYFFIRIDKKKAIKIIVAANTARAASTLETFDELFLLSWASAIRGKDAAFYHNGKTYVTESGKEMK